MVYHIDYDAYKSLSDYLHDIELRLPQDDRQEIMTDIEARVAELFQKALFAKNIQVVNAELVQTIRAQIGEPSDFGPNRRPKVKVNKSQNTGCGRALGIFSTIVLAIIALPIVFFGIFALISVFSISLSVGLFSSPIPGTAALLSALLVEHAIYILPLVIIALIAVVALPIIMIVYTIISVMRTRRGPKPRFWWITILLWLASIFFSINIFVRFAKTLNNMPSIYQSIMLDDFDIDEAGVAVTPLDLPAYHSIELKGAAKLCLCNADSASTVLTSNLVHTLTDSSIDAEVRDSVLYIDVNSTLSITETMVHFDIAQPFIQRVTVYGASKIETYDAQSIVQPSLILDLNGAAKADLQLHVQQLTIDAKGASSLELSGTAENAHITIAGAGELEAEDMVSQTMHINCAGASQAEIHVIRELWAQAAGASKISYQGYPRIKQKMAVGGSIIKQD